MMGRRWVVGVGLVVVLVASLWFAGVGAALVGDGQETDGQSPEDGPPVAWIESAQPPDWDALRVEAQAEVEAERQRSGEPRLGGAGGATGAQEPVQSDPVPEVPPLVVPEGDWPSYEWRDGDQTYEVWLDRSVAMVPDGGGFRFEDRVGGVAGAVGAGSSGYPAFRSSSGALMALPGGVILVLDPEWDAVAVNRFLERNGIADAERTVFDFVPNGFLIATEPGFAALYMANDLAAQDGVEIATPNWLIQQVLE